MGKFMKACGIIALICLVIGIILAVVVGKTEGMGNVIDVVQSVTDGKININLEDGFGIFVDGSDWIEKEGMFDIDDNTIFDKDYEIFDGDVEKHPVGEKASNLKIQVGGCTFYFEKSADDSFYVEATNAGKFQCFVKNDTLYVKSSRTTVDSWDELEDGEIILYIPEDYHFNELEAELGAGRMDMKDITANTVNLEVGAGQILIDYLAAKDCDVEVGMGQVVVNGMQVTMLDAEVGMGNLKMDGAVRGNIDAECSMGSIEFVLEGNQKDFNYNLDAAMGNVFLANDSYSDLTSDQTIQNGAAKHMNIKCAMGNIDVNFID